MRDQGSNLTFGSHARAYPGMSVCGDAPVLVRGEGYFLAGLIDGLGHGLDAAVAADRAVQVISSRPSRDIGRLLWTCHDALRSTRGAAVGLLRVEEDGSGEFCGVGNIEVLAVGPRPAVFSRAGIVGHHFRHTTPMSFKMARGDVYCLVTDGVSSRADVGACLPAPPDIAARRLVERWGRFSDDASALVVAYGAAFDEPVSQT